MSEKFNIIDAIEKSNNMLEVLLCITIMSLFNIKLSEEDENRIKEICKSKFPTD